MTTLEAALEYAGCGWPVFPCGATKQPLTDHGFLDATTDSRQITEWFGWLFPHALIGVPTGKPTGLAVLDIDVKGGVNGFRTLDEIDSPIRPITPTVLTASGGAHLYFLRPESGLRNTNGERGRGIGPGLDWRGDGGYVVVPTPGTGYRWGEWHFGNCNPIPVPLHLIPREPDRIEIARPVAPEIGLSRYAAKALDSACRRITGAPCGKQEATLNGEAFSIGTLAGAGAIPADFALEVLIYAAGQMPSYDPRRPWTKAEITKKVERSFNDGERHPRSAANG